MLRHARLEVIRASLDARVDVLAEYSRSLAELEGFPSLKKTIGLFVTERYSTQLPASGPLLLPTTRTLAGTGATPEFRHNSVFLLGFNFKLKFTVLV